MNPRARTIIKVLALLPLCLWCAGCVRPSPERDETAISDIPAHVKPLIGSWKKTARDGALPLVLTFKRDNKCKINNGRETIFGDYTVADSTLCLRDDDCGPVTGTYNYRVDGSALVLGLVADSANRAEVLPGIWTRKY